MINRKVGKRFPRYVGAQDVWYSDLDSYAACITVRARADPEAQMQLAWDNLVPKTENPNGHRTYL